MQTSELEQTNVSVAELDKLRDWASRIHMATICGSNDAIAEIVKEIRRMYHCSEGEDMDDKWLRVQECMQQKEENYSV